MKQDLYEQVNNRIIELLEKGVAPWRQSWKNGACSELPRNIVSGKEYRGINLFLLRSMQYSSPVWGTYKQIQSKGGNVKKGEKGTLGVFWKILSYKEQGKDGKEKDKSFPLLRAFYVFNVEQCEGLKFDSSGNVELVNHDPIESCERLIGNFPLGFPKAQHNLGKAFYRPSEDLISIPEKGLYSKVEEYYQTLFHEACHATGHKSRLDREGVQGVSFYGDAVYSQEELIAEIGASYLSAIAKIDNATIENSASYLSGWLSALRKDNKLIIKAAGQAQKAVDYLTGYKYEEIEE